MRNVSRKKNTGKGVKERRLHIGKKSEEKGEMKERGKGREWKE